MSEKRFETIEAFAEAVRTEFEKRIEKSAIVQKINKNNGIMLYALTVLEDEINISATIYLEPYYEVYEDTGMEYILSRLERVYEENKPEQSFDISKILDYESIKENLRAKLINYELNKDFLKEVPHRRFLDLAIVAFLELESNELIEGLATITVKDNLQKAWGVEAGDIIDAALDNIKGDITLNDNIVVDDTTSSFEIVAQGDYPDSRSDHQANWDIYKNYFDDFSVYGTDTAGKGLNDLPYGGDTGYDPKGTILQERTTDKGYTVMYDTDTGKVYYSSMILPTGDVYLETESGGVLATYAYAKGYNNCYDITYDEMQEILGVYNGD